MTELRQMPEVGKSRFETYFRWQNIHGFLGRLFSASKPIFAIRLLIAGLCTLLFTLCVSAQAQQAMKVPRIGYESGISSEEREEAFRQGLRELCYVEGQNIFIEWRFAQGRSDQVPRNAAELVRLNVDVIVTGGATDTRAAKEATSTIPIVMTNDNDPVGTGIVSSLARPGGNITGLTSLSGELRGKQLELLKEAFPRLSHVIALHGPGTQSSAVKQTDVVARSLGLQLQSQVVKERDDLNRAFNAISKANTGALIVVGGLFSTAQRKRIVEFATNSRLPAIYYRRELVEDGGLMSYDANRNDLARRAALFVDKILKGAKPANLPVEQPTKFELVINLKAAKQIGLTIPPNVLARADRVLR
jgi:putative tryptophan/tyrosine transport system substrate-binding protein